MLLGQHCGGITLICQLITHGTLSDSQDVYDATLSSHGDILYQVPEVEGKLHIRHVAKLNDEARLGSWRYEALGEHDERHCAYPLWLARLGIFVCLD